jgi:NAD(P)-dependent dehydrogenase (short-subunit alcohol dehydrogenase family)
MYPDLKDKVVIITGARRGMGKSHALAFAKEGSKVVVSDISLEDCQKVVKEIEEIKGEAMAVKCDVSKKEEVREMIEKTIKKWGKIDILINNAGIADFKNFLELKEEDWDRTIDINLKGYFLVAQAVAKEMVKRKSGVIINIASIAMGQVGIGFPSLTHYCASKGGIVGMTEAMAIELAPFNIRVNVISPGAIETPMVDPLKADKKTIEALLARIPMKRMGKPEEVSNLVLFLASESSSYMTGANVVIDGGWLAT